MPRPHAYCDAGALLGRFSASSWRSLFSRFVAVAIATGIGFLTAAGAAHAAPRAVLGGGSGIIIDDNAVCTLATIGRDSAGRLVGFTAAHCAAAGSSVVAESHRDAGVVGTVAQVNENLDYAVIVFDSNVVTPVNRIGATTITGIGGPAQFPAIACKQGRSTGQTCGLTYGDVFSTQTWTVTQICVLVGDSGGPMVVGTTLVGIVNGYIQIPCLGPQVGVAFTVILDDLGARGGAGAGFHPI